jgi:uncharacterized membrane protein
MEKTIMKLNSKTVRKSIIIVLVGLVTAFTAELLFLLSLPSRYDYRMSGNIRELHDNAVTEPISSIHFVFAEPVLIPDIHSDHAHVMVQVLFSDEESEPNWESALEFAIPEYAVDFKLSFPEPKEYAFLYFDIDGVFSVGGIYVSDAQVSKAYVPKSINAGRVALGFALTAIVLSVLSRFFGLSEILRGIKSRVKGINGKSLLWYIVSLILSVIALLVLHSAGIIYNIYLWGFVAAFLLIVVFVYLNRHEIAEKPERGFVIVSLAIGTLFSFCTPTSFVTWDDKIHFREALYLSYLTDNAITHADFSIISREHLTLLSVEESYEQHRILQQKQSDGFINQEIPTRMGTQAGIAYIPHSSGLFTGRVLQLPYILVFNLGRWFNLIFYTTIVYLAIKKLKSGKMILSAVALIPTNMYQASNYSADVWLTVLLMLGFAYFFSEMQQPKSEISAKSCVIIIASMFFAVCVKAIYFPLLLLPLLLPADKFRTVKQRKLFRISLVTASVLLLMTFMLPFVVAGPGTGDPRGGELVNSAEQVRFILNNPVQYAGILLEFLPGYFSTMHYFTVNFCYLGVCTNFIMVFAVLFFVILTDRNKCDKLITSCKTKGLITAVCFVTVCLIATALYVAFTAVGSAGISGCQPRYLLPFVFPMCMIFGSVKITNNIGRTFYNNAVLSFSALILLLCAWEAFVMDYSFL